MTDASKPAGTAIIIGAGPAGLTAAYELIARTDIRPIVLESDAQVGGIARTCVYKNNRMDIGGHRFFTKSDRVMDWWLARVPIEGTGGPVDITYHHQTTTVDTSAHDEARGPGMLVRERQSRVYYLRQFFDYPITLSLDTIRKLGIGRTFLIGMSYLWSRVFQIKPEKNLEEFFINRFGRRLYETFFKDYTEKVWGQPCREIGADWGAQRIKGLSLVSAIKHAVTSVFAKKKTQDVRQKNTETSLIERFLYPRFGPGQIWETVAGDVAKHGEVLLGWKVESIARSTDGTRIVSVTAVNAGTGERRVFTGDWFFSTMPIKDLIRGMDGQIPAAVREVSDGLIYRDFITVGLLLKKMKVSDAGARVVRDNWIYIQEPDVKIGRLQIFNNWSPSLVADANTAWLGLEYFCNEGDALWNLSDADMRALGVDELERIGLIDRGDVLDATVIRVPKTYPSYTGTYGRLDEIRAFVEEIPNLFLVGRNGMHRYNNQDHSMLTAMAAVDNIVAGRTDKSNLWAINTEQDYHEEKTPAARS